MWALQCALSFCYTKSVGSCSFPWSHAPHTDLWASPIFDLASWRRLLTIVFFLSPSLSTFATFTRLTLFRRLGFPLNQKGEYGKRWSMWNYRNSKNAESRLGNVLTALQILIHLIFTISWTWCIVVFLCFSIYMRDLILILALLGWQKWSVLSLNLHRNESSPDLSHFSFHSCIPKPSRLADVRKQNFSNFYFHLYMTETLKIFLKRCLVTPTKQLWAEVL